LIVGIGIDVLEISRLRRSLAEHGTRFTSRVFTPAEREFCLSRSDPAPHFAARFAAKEALFKAIGTGWAKGVRWQDVEVRRDGARPPDLHLSGEAARRCRTLGVSAVHISLSHSENTAVAAVILEK